MAQPATTDALRFLAGTGEMATLMRRKDWSGTPVGPPETWPQSLRTTLSIILRSRFPMFLFWGPELLCFYNDAYRASLGNDGKHPDALGERGETVWPEIWPTIKPLIDQVLLGGEATWSEDQLMPIYRNGRLEDVYWTFSYSPVDDESGRVAGVFVTCTETTKVVIDRQRLRESEARLERVLEQAPVAMNISKGPDHVIEIANERMLALWGRPLQSVLGRPTFEVFPEAKGQGFEAILEAVYTTGDPFRAYELPATLVRNGTLETIFVNVVYEPLRDEHGAVEGIMQVATDVTEQVLVRQKLAESEARFRLMANSLSQVIWVADAQGNVEFMNQQWVDYSGIPFEPAPSAQIAAQVVHPDDVPRVMAAFEEAMRTGQPFEVEQRNRSATGQYRWFLNRAHPYRHPATGEIVNWFGSGTDIHDRKEAEEALRASEQLLNTMIRQTPLGIGIVHGSAFRIDLANPTLCQLWGRTSDEVLGKLLFEALPEAAGQGFEELLTGVLETGVAFEGHELPATLLRHGKLETVYFDFTYTPLPGPDGRTERIMIVATDVTKSREGRLAVVESEKRFRAIADTAPVLIWLSGTDALCYFFNKGWLDFTGRPMEAEVGNGWVEGVHPDDFERCLKTYLTAFEARQEFYMEYRLRRHDGQYRWLSDRGIPRFDTDGVFLGFIGGCSDIHDTKLVNEELEQRVTERTDLLRRANRDLERSNLDLVQFASVASHDLKEPLRKVQTFGTRLQELLAGRMTGEEADLFRRMVNATVRMQALVTDVLRLSKLSDQTVSFELVDLNAVVAQIREDVELTIREQGAEVLVGNLPTVWAVPGQMHQLLLNLISNALKFQDSRQPEIRLEPVPVTDELMHQLALPAPDYAVISVSDNGIGFDPRYKDKIFGMFQRLHGRSQYGGTGIGLTIVKKIVENHQGVIDVQSQPGRGTTFLIAIPLSLTPTYKQM